MSGKFLNKFVKNTISVLGISVKEGQQLTGVEQAPAHFRAGGLLKAIEKLGWNVEDQGDMVKESFQNEINDEISNTKQYKYILRNIEVLGVMNKYLSKIAKEASEQKKFFLALGGDHGLATGSISGMLHTYPDLKVVWVDAHGDCETPEISPSCNYHGMPVAHLLGWMPQGSVKSFDWLKPALNPRNIVYIGLRDLEIGEKILLDKHKIKIFTPYDIENCGGIAKVMDESLKYLNADKDQKNPIHLSWDIDGCDPHFIKSTGTKARCGLSERESHFILQKLFDTGNMVGMDLVEVNPMLEAGEKMREVFHGDDKILTGTPTVVHGMEMILSALGRSWRY